MVGSCCLVLAGDASNGDQRRRRLLWQPWWCAAAMGTCVRLVLAGMREGSTRGCCGDANKASSVGRRRRRWLRGSCSGSVEAGPRCFVQKEVVGMMKPLLRVISGKNKEKRNLKQENLVGTPSFPAHSSTYFWWALLFYFLYAPHILLNPTHLVCLVGCLGLVLILHHVPHMW